MKNEFRYNVIAESATSGVFVQNHLKNTSNIINRKLHFTYNIKRRTNSTELTQHKKVSARIRMLQNVIVMQLLNESHLSHCLVLLSEDVTQYFRIKASLFKLLHAALAKCT
ncbi:CLUMA_CG005640, isoform A [Clunio marinus]|uniref:CLUMA_CG005640, isoform A n=1 Tax=Clunio marinus TaxID=568069 RepID=A0A1J1HXI9_9DIPT|nr:CLUMA_CG005640, isoform A [Clunio marinus]